MAKKKIQRRVKKLKMGPTFRDCPACDYQDGFHSMFQKAVNTRRLKWLLICPMCSSTFDIGLTLPQPK
jgi:hypothetical protein